MKQSRMCFAYVSATQARQTVEDVYEFTVPFDTLIEEFDLSEENLIGSPETHTFVVCSLLDYSLSAHISTMKNLEERSYRFSALIGKNDQTTAINPSPPYRLGLLVIEKKKTNGDVNNNPMEGVKKLKEIIANDGLFTEKQINCIISIAALMSGIEGSWDERIQSVWLGPKE